MNGMISSQEDLKRKKVICVGTENIQFQMACTHLQMVFATARIPAKHTSMSAAIS